MSTPENGKQRCPLEDLALIPLAEMNLPTQDFNAFEKAGFHTVDDLMRCSPEELLRIKGIGKTALDRVQRAMRILRARDPDDTSDSPPESTDDQNAAVLIASLRELNKQSDRTNTDRKSDELASRRRMAMYDYLFQKDNSLKHPRKNGHKTAGIRLINDSSVNEVIQEASDS